MAVSIESEVRRPRELREGNSKGVHEADATGQAKLRIAEREQRKALADDFVSKTPVAPLVLNTPMQQSVYGTVSDVRTNEQGRPTVDLQLRDGSKMPIDFLPTSYITVLRNLDNADHNRLPGVSGGLESQVQAYLKPGTRLMAEGTLFGATGHFDAGRV